MAKKKTKRTKAGYHYRDSNTGQYTTEGYAKRHPATTEKERVRRR